MPLDDAVMEMVPSSFRKKGLSLGGAGKQGRGEGRTGGEQTAGGKRGRGNVVSVLETGKERLTENGNSEKGGGGAERDSGVQQRDAAVVVDRSGDEAKENGAGGRVYSHYRVAGGGRGQVERDDERGRERGRETFSRRESSSRRGERSSNAGDRDKDGGGRERWESLIGNDRKRDDHVRREELLPAVIGNRRRSSEGVRLPSSSSSSLSEKKPSSGSHSASFSLLQSSASTTTATISNSVLEKRDNGRVEFRTSGATVTQGEKNGDSRKERSELLPIGSRSEESNRAAQPRRSQIDKRPGELPSGIRPEERSRGAQLSTYDRGRSSNQKSREQTREAFSAGRVFGRAPSPSDSRSTLRDRTIGRKDVERSWIAQDSRYQRGRSNEYSQRDHREARRPPSAENGQKPARESVDREAGEVSSGSRDSERNSLGRVSTDRGDRANENSKEQARGACLETTPSDDVQTREVGELAIRHADSKQQTGDFDQSEVRRPNSSHSARDSAKENIDREPGELSSGDDETENGNREAQNGNTDEQARESDDNPSPKKKRKFTSVVWDVDEKQGLSGLHAAEAGKADGSLFPVVSHSLPSHLQDSCPRNFQDSSRQNFPQKPVGNDTMSESSPQATNPGVSHRSGNSSTSSESSTSPSSPSSPSSLSSGEIRSPPRVAKKGTERAMENREQEHPTSPIVGHSIDIHHRQSDEVQSYDSGEREPGELPPESDSEPAELASHPQSEAGEISLNLDSEPGVPHDDRVEEATVMSVVTISTSRWVVASPASEAKGSEEHNFDPGNARKRRFSQQNGKRSTGSKSRSRSPDREEDGESDGNTAAQPHDSDYEERLNLKELMELDREQTGDEEEEEEEQRPEEDSEIEEPETPGPPARAIDMLQGCRNVNEFQMMNRIDEGTYGVVYQARNRKTGEVVALKKVKMEMERDGFPKTALREMNVLLSIHHPSVVNVKEVVVGSTIDSVYMVMEFMEHELKGLMETMKQPFSHSEVKCLMLQLFNGVNYLHGNWVLHRDLKTSNLLMNNKGEIKICDFGLARQYGSPLQAYSNRVVTLWYRAPELLLGSKFYSTAIDMWSLGCIMAELLAKQPLLTGKSEIEQIGKIFKLLGTPNEKIWPDFVKLPGAKCNFPNQPFDRLREKFPATGFSGQQALSDSGFDLLKRLLEYDPKKRITAEEAMSHAWFQEEPLAKSKEFMPTFPPRSLHDRKLKRLMEEQKRRELQEGTRIFG